MLDINPGLTLWTIITFIVVLAILRAAAWKPLIAAIVAREESIRKSLADAEVARSEAVQLRDETNRQLAMAEEQSQRIIRDGREMGERLKAELLEKAQTSSRHMIEQAKEEIQREKEAALVQLRGEVSDLVLGAAGKVLDANLDTPKQRQLAESAIREITQGA
jgi:F-type H+-transporting ATPase subunit b